MWTSCEWWILGAFLMGGTGGIVVMCLMITARDRPTLPPDSVSPLDTATHPIC